MMYYSFENFGIVDNKVYREHHYSYLKCKIDILTGEEYQLSSSQWNEVNTFYIDSKKRYSNKSNYSK